MMTLDLPKQQNLPSIIYYHIQLQQAKDCKQKINTSIRLRARINVDKQSRSLGPYTTKNTHNKRQLIIKPHCFVSIFYNHNNPQPIQIISHN